MVYLYKALTLGHVLKKYRYCRHPFIFLNQRPVLIATDVTSGVDESVKDIKRSKLNVKVENDSVLASWFVITSIVITSRALHRLHSVGGSAPRQYWSAATRRGRCCSLMSYTMSRPIILVFSAKSL